MPDKTAPGIKSRNREKYDRIKRLMWIKCESCGRLVYYKDFKEKLRICPKCGHTTGLTPLQRYKLLFDDVNWKQLDLPIVSDDPISFVDRMSYADRLEDARAETDTNDAISAADGKIGGIDVTMAVMNADFMMGSMGRAVGDGIIAAIEHAIEKKNPFIIVTSSGGARMQENVLALMQMARTTAAVNKLHAARLPYIVILTDPTFGGTTASFAMLGDIHIAEAGARIGFAGRRVIEQNMHEKLPGNFQSADYLYEHGMIDIVSSRADMAETLARILRVATKQDADAAAVSIATPAVDTRAASRSRKKKKDESTPAYDKVLLARNENRPHFLDYVRGLCTDWTPLAGDRLFAEDPAMQGGLCFFRGIPAMVIGQEKGRDIATRTKYRFGMPNPEGYRKAQRLMRLAEKYDLPVITLVDTSGAYAGKEGEERGQSQAVATSMQTGLKIATSYVSAIVGEGGSGGAIAIATGDKILMMENAIYSVIAPESASSILWKDNKFKAKAAEAMKLTAKDLEEIGVIDEIVHEPSGGAHTDWQTAMEQLGDAIAEQVKILQSYEPDDLPLLRAKKFFSMTRDVEIYSPENEEL